MKTYGNITATPFSICIISGSPEPRPPTTVFAFRDADCMSSSTSPLTTSLIDDKSRDFDSCLFLLIAEVVVEYRDCNDFLVEFITQVIGH